MRGDITFVKRQLDARLVNPDDDDAYGNTGLTQAVNSGNLAMVKVFVNAGADVNYLNGDVPTSNPLYQAQGVPEVYSYLQSHGATIPESIRRYFVLGVNAHAHR